MAWEAGTPEPVSETTRSSEPYRMWGKEETGMEGAGEQVLPEGLKKLSRGYSGAKTANGRGQGLDAVTGAGGLEGQGRAQSLRGRLLQN